MLFATDKLPSLQGGLDKVKRRKPVSFLEIGDQARDRITDGPSSIRVSSALVDARGKLGSKRQKLASKHTEHVLNSLDDIVPPLVLMHGKVMLVTFVCDKIVGVEKQLVPNVDQILVKLDSQLGGVASRGRRSIKLPETVVFHEYAGLDNEFVVLLDNHDIELIFVFL